MNTYERLVALNQEKQSTKLSHVGDWASACLIADEKSEVPINGAYRSYLDWTTGRNLHVWGKKGLVVALRSHGIDAGPTLHSNAVVIHRHRLK